MSDLRTPTEWADLLGIEIHDPDGWRGTMHKDFGEPVSAAEFDHRVNFCTVRANWWKPFPKAVNLPTDGGAA